MDINTNNLQLEEFNEYGARFSRKISITKAESFGFPSAFYKENNLSRFKAAKLYYDKGTKVIGIKFIESADDDASFRIMTYGAGNKISAGFGARSFFNKYELDVEKIYGKYDYVSKQLDNIGELFLIQITENRPE